MSSEFSSTGLIDLVWRIIARMVEDSQNSEIPVRVIRDGLPEPPDNDWLMASPEERIEAVWDADQALFGMEQSFRN